MSSKRFAKQASTHDSTAIAESTRHERHEKRCRRAGITAADRLATSGNAAEQTGRYVLESDEDPERIFFDYDAGNGVLLPQRWEFEQKARFLFKKFHVEAYAEYSDVVFARCPAAPDTTGEN